MSNSLVSRVAATLVAGAALAVSAFAQTGNEEPTVSLTLPKTPITAGTQITATVIVTFADGLHGYQNPPSEEFQIPVKVTVDGKTFTLVKAKYPGGVDATMGGDPKPFKAYVGRVAIPITLKTPAKAGTHQLKVVVSYQQCNDQSCFPPSEVSASAKVTVKPKAKAKG